MAELVAPITPVTPSATSPLVRTTVDLVPGVALLAAIGLTGKWIQDFTHSYTHSRHIRSPEIEYSLWAILIGFAIANVARLPAVLKPGIATYEFFLKLGIVLLGARFLRCRWTSMPEGWGPNTMASRKRGGLRRMATAEDVREIALTLPRAYEVWVRDRVKYRVGRIVFLSLSPDESLLGFGFPKEMREARVAAEPRKFLMPIASDMRYNWLRLRLAEVERDELWELIVDAWWGTVPKFVREAFMAKVEQERATASNGTA
jgi:hypothetical protein